MATFYSEQVTKLNAVPAVPLNVDESHGKIRICQFDYEQVAEGAIATIIELVKLPAGRIRVLGRESNLYHSALGTGVTLDVGWAAHVDFAGEIIAADPDGFDDGLDVAAAGRSRLGSVAAVLAEAEAKVFESQEGIVITTTIGVAVIPAGGKLKGYIAYVLD